MPEIPAVAHRPLNRLQAPLTDLYWCLDLSSPTSPGTLGSSHTAPSCSCHMPSHVLPPLSLYACCQDLALYTAGSFSEEKLLLITQLKQSHPQGTLHWKSPLYFTKARVWLSQSHTSYLKWPCLCTCLSLSSLTTLQNSWWQRFSYLIIVVSCFQTRAGWIGKWTGEKKVPR